MCNVMYTAYTDAKTTMKSLVWVMTVLKMTWREHTKSWHLNFTLTRTMHQELQKLLRVLKSSCLLPPQPKLMGSYVFASIGRYRYICIYVCEQLFVASSSL